VSFTVLLNLCNKKRAGAKKKRKTKKIISKVTAHEVTVEPEHNYLQLQQAAAVGSYAQAAAGL
jgi:hypothetical protein